MQRLIVFAVLLLVCTGCAGTLGATSGGGPLRTSTPRVNVQPTGAAPAPPLVPFATVGPVTLPPATTPLTATTVASETAVPPVSPPVGAPTVIPDLGGVQLPQVNLRDRWRAQQIERAPLAAPQVYVAPSYTVVYWFDPLFGTIAPVGELKGEFDVQATFRVRGQWIEALEIPLNFSAQQYGVVIPEALVQRMRAAGLTEWAEVFIYRTRDILPKPR